MRSLVAVWVVIGCGDGVTLPDAAAPSSARGTVSVRVADDDGDGISGCQVYFQSADSLVEGAAVTGSDGMATAEVTDGGYVTVVDGDHTTTFAGVVHGDVLAVPHPTASLSLPNVEMTVVDLILNTTFGWTTCGPLFFDSSSTVQIARCDSSADVLFENYTTYMPMHAVFQTVALVDGGVIDITLSNVDEVAETITLLNAPLYASVQQYLITSRGRLRYFDLADPSLVLYQPSIPGATFETIVRATVSNTNIFVIDPTAPTTAYQLDLAGLLPTAVGTFKTGLSEVRWSDDGQRPGTFAVAQGAGWSLIAPIEYRETDAVLRLPALPGTNATPTLDSVTTFNDGETYDTARPHGAEYLHELQGELDLSGVQVSGKSTPSRRFVAQTIFNCEGSQDCE